MTSQERHEARYQRRKRKRQIRIDYLTGIYGNFDRIFTYSHLCRKGVSWKGSVQRYIEEAPLRIYRSLKKLQSGEYGPRGYWNFDIIERGKKRHIQSVHIDDRVIQRCLCDYSLVPMLGRSFIYDNGACMKDKGQLFASKRLIRHLRRYYRRYGTNGYILLFDFSKFFERIRHSLAKKILRDHYRDPRLLRLVNMLIDRFPGKQGLGLGSQISQILALSVPNGLDHFIKDVLKIEAYGRYNDDGYLIHPSKAYLGDILCRIRSICKQLGIKLNSRKTQIVKLSHGFTYLKARYYLLPTGRILKKLPKGSVAKERRKLKKLRAKLLEGLLSNNDFYQSRQSWNAYAKSFDGWHSRQQIYYLVQDIVNPIIHNKRRHKQ